MMEKVLRNNTGAINDTGEGHMVHHSFCTRQAPRGLSGGGGGGGRGGR